MNKNLVKVRTAIIIFYAVCILFLAYILIRNPLENDLYGGISHDPNLFHCPTCGLTRCIYCLCHFDFKMAFYYNAFFVVTLPLTAYIMVTLTVNLFMGKKIIPYPKHYGIILYAFLGAFLIFGVARNFISVIY